MQAAGSLDLAIRGCENWGSTGSEVNVGNAPVQAPGQLFKPLQTLPPTVKPPRQAIPLTTARQSLGDRSQSE